MTDIAGADIEHLAKLARLELSEEEKQKFGSQLPKIVQFVEELQGASVTDGIENTGVSLEGLREDKVSPSHLTIEELEKLAPKFENNKIVVPPVFGESNDV